MTEVLKAGVLSDEIDLGALAHNAAEQAEEFVRKVSWCQWSKWNKSIRANCHTSLIFDFLNICMHYL